MDSSQTLEVCKDVLESGLTWRFINFKTLINENLLSEELKTETISIPGFPFKWQLRMKISEKAEPGAEQYSTKKSYSKGMPIYSVPAASFKLVFSEDSPVPTKYKKIKCDFKVGTFWNGSASLFPEVDNPTREIMQGVMKTTLIGGLKIKCHMTVTGYYFDNKRDVFDNSRSNGNKLLKDIGAMLLSEEDSDLTLVVKNQELKVHKSILAARSPVFKLMLSTEMKEKLESRITIPNVSVEAAKMFVKFLYTAEVTATEHLKDLLSLATLYQMEDLKETCERMLINQLNGDNAMDNLRLANLHNCVELKQKSFQMIADGALSSLRTFPDGLMNKPEEVEEMMTALKKCNEASQQLLNSSGLKKLMIIQFRRIIDLFNY